MTPDDELKLVRKAIEMGKTVTGCFEWHHRAVVRVEQDPDLLGVKPVAIRQIAIEHARTGGIIRQVREQRPEYSDYEFYYKMIVAVHSVYPE